MCAVSYTHLVINLNMSMSPVGVSVVDFCCSIFIRVFSIGLFGAVLIRAADLPGIDDDSTSSTELV